MKGNVRPEDMARIQTREQAEAYIEKEIQEIRETVGKDKVLLALPVAWILP